MIFGARAFSAEISHWAGTDTFHSFCINSDKPSVRFVGHRQTVQNQIRHHKTRLAGSGQVLHCLLTEVIFNI